jgi:two-component system, NtrC family, response regulator AtoC
VRAVAEEVLAALRRHPWPGNVRQLRNAVERAVVMSEGEVLLPQHLPPDILAPPPPSSSNGTHPSHEAPLVTLDEMEQQMIRRALRESAKNVTLAAERLGIHRNTLRRKITEYGIEQE